MVSAFFPLCGCGKGTGTSVEAPTATFPSEKAPSPSEVAPQSRTEPASEPDWTIPQQYAGQLVRKRVRYFLRKLLALTFDDGPDAVVTPRILAALAEHDAHATFFVLGRQAKQHPDLLKQMAAEGHVIGNHSYSHPSRTSPQEAGEELDRTEAAIEDAVGRKPRLFRPPYGITDGNLSHLALSRGYTGVLWTISSADSRPIGPDVIAKNVIHTPNPSDIVLMHDGPGHKDTADALPRILQELGEAGFEFVTMPELLRAWDKWQS